MVDLRRAAAIVGVHEHVTRYAPDKSELQIQGESIIKAFRTVLILSKKDVDVSSFTSDSRWQAAGSTWPTTWICTRPNSAWIDEARHT